MKKLSGDELAKEIGCDAGTLKKTCMSTPESVSEYD